MIDIFSNNPSKKSTKSMNIHSKKRGSASYFPFDMACTRTTAYYPNIIPEMKSKLKKVTYSRKKPI